MVTRIFFSGDIVNCKSKENFISDELIKIIQDQDFAVCNFEAPIKGFGKKIAKAGPHINQRPETIQILKDSGYDLLLLANNHMYDYGEGGLAATLAEISKVGLISIGAGLDIKTAYQPLIRNINDLKVAFLNASEAQFGVLDGSDSSRHSGYAWINHYIIDDTIQVLKDNVDTIIVCVHAGLEDYSVPIEEWRNRYKRLCDLGADCIIGSHPHVPQGYEFYKNKPIFYSLGNFYFDTESYAYQPDYSYSVILEISKEGVAFKPVFHCKNGGKLRLISKDETPVNIDLLNSQLIDIKALEDVYVNAYKNIIFPFFTSVFDSIEVTDSFIKIMKKIIYKFISFGKVKKRKELLLFHLVKNETYRWITQKGIMHGVKNKPWEEY